MKKSIQVFLNDQRGSVITFMAVGIFVAVGMAAFAVDASYFYILKNRLQTTADIAALASVRQFPDENMMLTVALEYSTKNMPINNHGNVLANTDVETGNWNSNTRTFTPANNPLNAVRIITRRSQANDNAAGTFFANIFGIVSVDITTSAIAALTATGEICVLALSPTASDAISTSGGAPVSLDGCSIMANSTADDSVSIGGSSALEVDCISTAGGVSGTPTLNTCGEVNDNASPIPDPYADLVMPIVSYCDYGTYNTQDGSLSDINGDGYIKVCGKLTIKGNFTLQDNVTYIIEDAFAMNAGAVATATSVTFIAQNKVSINGSTSLSLTAPNWDQQFVGQTGMVLIQDPSTPNSPNNQVKLNGGSDTEFTGVIYVPNNDVTFTGGNSSDDDGCTQIVGLTVSFTGGADIENNCSMLGVSSLVLSSSSLVR